MARPITNLWVPPLTARLTLSELSSIRAASLTNSFHICPICIGAKGNVRSTYDRKPTAVSCRYDEWYGSNEPKPEQHNLSVAQVARWSSRPANCGSDNRCVSSHPPHSNKVTI